MLERDITKMMHTLPLIVSSCYETALCWRLQVPTAVVQVHSFQLAPYGDLQRGVWWGLLLLDHLTTEQGAGGLQEARFSDLCCSLALQLRQLFFKLWIHLCNKQWNITSKWQLRDSCSRESNSHRKQISVPQRNLFKIKLGTHSGHTYPRYPCTYPCRWSNPDSSRSRVTQSPENSFWSPVALTTEIFANLKVKA